MEGFRISRAEWDIHRIAALLVGTWDYQAEEIQRDFRIMQHIPSGDLILTWKSKLRKPPDWYVAAYLAHGTETGHSERDGLEPVKTSEAETENGPTKGNKGE